MERAVWDAVEKLPPKWKVLMSIVLLDLKSGMKLNISEIARALDISQAAAYERLENAMKRLGEILRENPDVIEWLESTDPDEGMENDGPVARLGKVLRDQQ